MALTLSRISSMMLLQAVIFLPTFIITHSLRAESRILDVITPASIKNVWHPKFSTLHDRFVPLTTFPPCTYNITTSYINCSWRHLSDVPTKEFPNSAKTYNINNNNITRLPDYAFQRYRHLNFLDLSYNLISVLGNYSFYGLVSLRYLDLFNNRLMMTKSMFPVNVFAPLSSLVRLVMTRNNPYASLNGTDMEYPDHAFSKLTSLVFLFLDGLTSKDFGPGFKNLRNLTTLSVDGFQGHCFLYSLRNTTFQYVTNVKWLYLDNCGIHGDRIEAGTFSPLKKLNTLSIGDNQEIGIQYLNRIFHGLADKTTLKSLHISSIVYFHSIGICVDSSWISDFPQHLTTLEVGDNLIEGIDRKVIEKLSPSLQYLDIRENNFAFGTYILDLPKMKSLTYLNYGKKEYRRSLPNSYPDSSHASHMDNSTSSNCSLYETRKDDPPRNGTFVIRLPPLLKTVEMNNAGLDTDLTEFRFDPFNNVEVISMSLNNFPHLVGPIVGLNSLKRLFLASNNIKEITPSFFQYMHALELLDLSSNFLGDFFLKESKTVIFSSLTKLSSLNLTFNEISYLPRDVFFGLDSMKTLLLASNPLTGFNINILHMHSLEYLDLKDTRIAFLPGETMHYLNFLASQHIRIQINLAKSPIGCNCDHLNFLMWLTGSNVTIKEKTGYMCLYPDSSTKIIYDFYASTLEVLHRECKSNVILFFFSGALTLITFIVILAAVVYRFRWRIRYMYYAAYLQYKKNPQKEEKIFEYDAFISYDTADTDFVVDKLEAELKDRGLKLCLHGRDFRAGEYIASNIVRAVRDSRRTVVVLTRAMMDSYWCKYEIQMANMESVQTGRRVLIFLLIEKIPENELGMELLYNIRNNTYIPYPNPEPASSNMERLWNKLAADIRD